MINPHDPVNLNGNWWHYDERTRTHRPAGDRAAGKTAYLEPTVGDEPMATCQGAATFARADITVVSYRSRLADADGISAKAAIDGLVMCGILADDSTKEIREVRYRQVKVKNASEEKTEIIIERVK